MSMHHGNNAMGIGGGMTNLGGQNHQYMNSGMNTMSSMNGYGSGNNTMMSQDVSTMNSMNTIPYCDFYKSQY